MNILPENIVNLAAATTERVQWPVINNIILDVLRLDKIDPVISGNKWFKLKYYLEKALAMREKRVITFGGPYSNHIIATASAAQKTGLQSIGIIRGEEPAAASHTLQQAAQLGMQLVYVTRELYNQKKNPAFIEQLLQKYGNACIIPEGGEGDTGIQGAAEILKLTAAEDYTHIVCAVGTGTLLAGLASGASGHQHITGIAVLKGFENWQPPAAQNYKGKADIVTSYHFGGYAKKNTLLIDFMNDWYHKTGIPSDFVYTGKLFFAVNDMLAHGYFAAGSRLLVIHSGGLQGNNSLPVKTLDF